MNYNNFLDTQKISGALLDLALLDHVNKTPENAICTSGRALVKRLERLNVRRIKRNGDAKKFRALYSSFRYLLMTEEMTGNE